MAKVTDKRWKGHLIDWDEINAMDSVEYAFHELNQQQVAILLMLLEYQKWTTRWTNLGISQSELQKYIGDIELRLMREELCDMATVEEICQAIECGFEKVAVRFINGTSENLIGGDVVLTPGNAPDVRPPGMTPDDTTTSADEEARSGGSSAIRLGINIIWSYMNTWYGQGVTQAVTTLRLLQIFTLEASLIDEFVLEYYTARDAAQPYISAFASTLDGYLFCKGKEIGTISRWVIDTLAANVQNQGFALANMLTSVQIDKWYNSGVLTPSTDYSDYPCTKTPSETIDVDLNTNTYYQGVQTWKVNHRLRITVDEFFVDPQGDIVDFWWNKQVGLPQTFKNNDTRIEVNAVEQEDASTNEVPYNGSHAYTWTMICLNTGLMRIRVNRGTGIDPTTTGTFHVLIEDLGEIIT